MENSITLCDFLRRYELKKLKNMWTSEFPENRNKAKRI